MPVNLYDKISALLTNYEVRDPDDDIYHLQEFYDLLVVIQNYYEDRLEPFDAIIDRRLS